MEKYDVLSKYPPVMENLLLILHALQNANPQRYLAADDLECVAAYLKVTLASIYGVASYYSMFSLKPRGKHIITVCRSPVCRMLGSDDILTEIERCLGVDVDETTADGLFTITQAECLGHCEDAPMMMIDRNVFGRLTPPELQSLLKTYGCIG